LHYGRKKIQPSGREISEFRDRARGALKHKLLDFQPRDFYIVADALSQTIQEHRYTCYACAIMPDHVHILIRKHKDHAEDMLERFQAISRLRLRAEGLRADDHPVWGGPGWKVFLDSPTDIRRTIRYIEGNPAKFRLPRQTWAFIQEYHGWPLHPGHSPNSPYVRRLQEYQE
jgi:REP element-mobilizing transposase RayT